LEIEVGIQCKARFLQVQCYFSIIILSSSASEEADLNLWLQKIPSEMP